VHTTRVREFDCLGSGLSVSLTRLASRDTARRANRGSIAKPRLLVVRESRAEGRARYDIPGVATSTLGLTALVYGFTKASESGWSAASTIALLAAAAVLLAAFVVIESRTAEPLLPPRVFTERNRAGAFLTSLLMGLALFGMFLFLVYYLQGTLHYSALTSGLAFLPFSGGVIAASTIASSLLPRVGPRVLMTGGTAAAAAAMGWFTQLTPRTRGSPRTSCPPRSS
jgi:Na+/melibiose symporter-like transporter